MYGEIEACWNATWDYLDDLIQSNIDEIQYCLSYLDTMDGDWTPQNQTNHTTITDNYGSTDVPGSADTGKIALRIDPFVYFILSFAAVYI